MYNLSFEHTWPYTMVQWVHSTSHHCPMSTPYLTPLSNEYTLLQTIVHWVHSASHHCPMSTQLHSTVQWVHSATHHCPMSTLGFTAPHNEYTLPHTTVQWVHSSSHHHLMSTLSFMPLSDENTRLHTTVWSVHTRPFITSMVHSVQWVYSTSQHCLNTFCLKPLPKPSTSCCKELSNGYTPYLYIPPSVKISGKWRYGRIPVFPTPRALTCVAHTWFIPIVLVNLILQHTAEGPSTEQTSNKYTENTIHLVFCSSVTKLLS